MDNSMRGFVWTICVGFCGSFYVWISMGDYMWGSTWKIFSVDLNVDLYVLI